MPRGGYYVNAGRPRRPAEEIAPSTFEERIRKAVVVLQEMDGWDIVKEAFCRHAKAMVGRSSKRVIKRALESERAAEEMLRKLDSHEVIRLPKDDAITMLLHLKISKHQYDQLAKMMNKFSGTSSSEHMVPCYNVVAEHKSTLRPRNVAVTEVKAQVPLQDLLQHTIERMVKSNERKITDMLKGKEEQRCTFTFCYGYDGASAQRKFKMRYREPGNENRDDKSLFAAVINPWALKTDDGKILWLNEYPQSSLYIRTFFLEFATETNEYLRRFNADLQLEMRNLTEVRVRAGLQTELIVLFRAHLTNIDGKVFNVLTQTTTGQCPCCRSGRDDFNVVANIGSERYAIEGLGGDCGVQSLHAIIKFFNLLKNLSFRLPAHRAGLQERTEAWRNSVEEQATIIIARCKERWGVTIDGPGQGGGGTSLDGNTCRRCFEDPDVLATVLDINPQLVRRFKTILLCINSTQFRLHVNRFERFAHETFRLYVQEYGWFKMSPSVHKVLIHAAEIQRNLNMPLGAASEGGAELLHRIRKEAKLHCTRKTSRLHHMQDLMNRCLDISDPLISSRAEEMLQKFRVRKPLPEDALRLLRTGGTDDDSPPHRPDDDSPPAPPKKRTRRQTAAVVPPTVQQNDRQNAVHDLDDDEETEDLDLGHVDGNETDYETDLDDDMETD